LFVLRLYFLFVFLSGFSCLSRVFGAFWRFLPFLFTFDIPGMPLFLFLFYLVLYVLENRDLRFIGIFEIFA
jgi:hypothetical protein